MSKRHYKQQLEMSKKDKLVFLAELIVEDIIKIDFGRGKVFSKRGGRGRGLGGGTLSDSYRLLKGEISEKGYILHRFSSRTHGTKPGVLQRIHLREHFIIYWGWQLTYNHTETLDRALTLSVQENPLYLEIDHINHETHRNELSNLRLLSGQKNTARQRRYKKVEDK